MTKSALQTTLCVKNRFMMTVFLRASDILDIFTGPLRVTHKCCLNDKMLH